MAKYSSDGTPRYIRCYDNGGETADRYTVVFTGRYRHKTGGAFWYVSMNAAPFHPQGIGQHGESDTLIDRPSYRHLGKRITFGDLSCDGRRLILQDYAYLWDAKAPRAVECSIAAARAAPA